MVTELQAKHSLFLRHVAFFDSCTCLFWSFTCPFGPCPGYAGVRTLVIAHQLPEVCLDGLLNILPITWVRLADLFYSDTYIEASQVGLFSLQWFATLQVGPSPFEVYFNFF